MKEGRKRKKREVWEGGKDRGRGKGGRVRGRKDLPMARISLSSMVVISRGFTQCFNRALLLVLD